MIQGSSILKTPTASFTGGTAQALTIIRNLGNAISAACTTDSDAKLRKQFEFKTQLSRPSPAGANGFSQSRSSVDCVFPKLLSNGVVTKNAGGVYIRVDPETTDAEFQDIKLYLAQMILDSDFSDFWRSQASV
jgi:hypothetical protein